MSLALWSPPGVGLRLDFGLIPTTATANLRTELPSEKWDSIRKAAKRAAEYRCVVCASADQLEVHERWVFDDDRGLQGLVGLAVLCELCHATTHAGRTISIHGQLGRDRIREHWCRINRLSVEDFEEHYRSARWLAGRRGQRCWRLIVPECGIDRLGPQPEVWGGGLTPVFPMRRRSLDRSGRRRGKPVRAAGAAAAAIVAVYLVSRWLVGAG